MLVGEELLDKIQNNTRNISFDDVEKCGFSECLNLVFIKPTKTVAGGALVLRLVEAGCFE